LAVVAVSTGRTDDSDKELALSEARSFVVRKYPVENFPRDDTRLKTPGPGTSATASEAIAAIAFTCSKCRVRADSARVIVELVRRGLLSPPGPARRFGLRWRIANGACTAGGLIHIAVVIALAAAIVRSVSRAGDWAADCYLGLQESKTTCRC
jgi:hypothetical protein